MSSTFLECYRHCIIWYSTSLPDFPYCVYNNWTDVTSCLSSVEKARRKIDRWIDEDGYTFYQCGDAEQEVSVLKKIDNSPVEGVSVSAIPKFSGGHQWSDSTDSNGKCVFSHLYENKDYSFSIIPPPAYTCDPCSRTVQVPHSALTFLVFPAHVLSPISLASLPPLSLAPPSSTRILSPLSLSSFPFLSTSVQSLSRILPPLSFSSFPSLSLCELQNMRVFVSHSLSPLPSLSVSELKNLLVLLSLSLPSPPPLSLFELKIISRELASLLLQDFPELTVSILLFTFPRQPLSDAIIVENMNALAEASFEHHRRAQFSNFNAPPFICLICGETFNTTDDFISHLIQHVTAYEEGLEEEST